MYDCDYGYDYFGAVGVKIVLIYFIPEIVLKEG